MTLRVTHCPVNVAGIPWANVQALRRRDVDASLVVFNRGRLHPQAGWSLARRRALPGKLTAPVSGLARLLPQSDVFHSYFGLTLVPKSLQFPVLRAARKKSVFHWLGSDIRGKAPAALAYGRRAGAQIVGSYDAIRWVPEAQVVPPGLDLPAYAPAPPRPRRRPPRSARSSCTPRRTGPRRARPTWSRPVPGSRSSSTSSRASPTTRPRRATRAPTSSSTS